MCSILMNTTGRVGETHRPCDGARPDGSPFFTLHSFFYGDGGGDDAVDWDSSGFINICCVLRGEQRCPWRNLGISYCCASDPWTPARTFRDSIVIRDFI